jgi:hypothetical protein
LFLQIVVIILLLSPKSPWNQWIPEHRPQDTKFDSTSERNYLRMSAWGRMRCIKLSDFKEWTMEKDSPISKLRLAKFVYLIAGHRTARM